MTRRRTTLAIAVWFGLGCLALEGSGTLLHGLLLRDLPAVDGGPAAVWRFLLRDVLISALAATDFAAGALLRRRHRRLASPRAAFAAGFGFALGLEALNWLVPGALLDYQGVARTGAAWLYFIGASGLLGAFLGRRDDAAGESAPSASPATGSNGRGSMTQESGHIDPPQVMRSDRHDAAVIHLRIPRDEMRSAFGPAIEEVLAALAAQGVAPKGPVFAHHLRMEPDVFDFELGVPVAVPIRVYGRVRPGELPATRVARTVYSGPYEGLPAAWQVFDRWLKAHGHRQAQDLWEVYAVGPDKTPDPSEWRTELNRPLLDEER